MGYTQNIRKEKKIVELRKSPICDLSKASFNNFLNIERERERESRILAS